MGIKARTTSILPILPWLALLMFMPGGLCSAAPTPTANDSPTTRIVSLVPNLTEIAFALGADEQIAGVSDFCHFPAEARSRPRVGGLINPNLEAVIRLRPDVVLLYRSQADFAARLKKLGIRSELFTVDRLADLYAAIDRLGTETGRTTTAAKMTSDIRKGLDALQPENKSTAPVSGVIVVSRDPAGLRSMYQASAKNFLGELYEIVGGKLAINGGPPITTEEVIRANPTLIIDMSYAASVTPGNPANELLNPYSFPGPWARLNTVSAVQTGFVIKWADPHALLLGPGVVDTARKMKALLPHSD